jgi:hypothetical protein
MAPDLVLGIWSVGLWLSGSDVLALALHMPLHSSSRFGEVLVDEGGVEGWPCGVIASLDGRCPSRWDWIAGAGVVEHGQLLFGLSMVYAVGSEGLDQFDGFDGIGWV